MIKVDETIQQFVLASLADLSSTIVTVLLSDWLDGYINHNISNAIGLSLDAFLDFFMVTLIFKSHEKYYTLIVSYVITLIARAIFAQVLYMVFHSYMNKYHPDWFNKNWSKEAFWIRYFIGAITYALVAFPLQKFWVFKK